VQLSTGTCVWGVLRWAWNNGRRADFGLFVLFVCDVFLLFVCAAVRQQLIEQGNRLTQNEFSRDEAQRRLVAETDELSRSRRLCSEMQKRVLEADEARRSDEQR
jgi:sensor histidine kinase YesM